MKKKKYYAITTRMTFEKTVLVPVDTVEDIDEAIDLVDCSVEIGATMVLTEEADCEIIQSPYADENGIYELTDEDAASYEILEGDYGDYED